MKEELEKLEVKIDKLDVRLDKIEKVMDRNTASLEYHVERTNILQRETAPVIKFYQQMLGAGKLLGLISLVLSITFAIMRLWR